jgi:MFS family permease
MTFKPKNIHTIYLLLVLGNTLAASFIWGINTIFLLDAGLSNFEAFLANAFFSLGQVIFEVPTGIIADTFGRRTSYLLGGLTLTISTLLYLFMWSIKGPFIGWAISSIFLGLGFTFFSGALEAWLVDALKATNFKGNLEDVFAKGQIVGGVAMLTGSFAGGVIAQFTSLSVPYILRAVILMINFATAFFFMKDLGFSPRKMKNPVVEMKANFVGSLDHGLRNRPVRWLMLAAPFTVGVSFYVFYALQPYLLKLYGDEKAYSIAGLIAMLTAGAQIAGGYFAPKFKNLFKKRTTALFTGIIISSILLALISLVNNFWLSLIFVFTWGLIFAALAPIRQAFINGAIPSEQRATVLSFDSLMGSAGGIFIQPTLGKVADMYGYSASFFVSGIFQVIAAPFILLAKKEDIKSDKIEK